MTLIIFFGISLLVLFLTIFSGWLSAKAGKKVFLSAWLAKLDTRVLATQSKVEFRWKQMVQTTKYIIFIVIPRKSEESFREAKRRAVQEYKKRKEIMMGKKDLNGGGASFFLKRIKEGQMNGKSGKIVDSLPQ